MKLFVTILFLVLTCGYAYAQVIPVPIPGGSYIPGEPIMIRTPNGMVWMYPPDTPGDPWYVTGPGARSDEDDPMRILYPRHR
jgi:hypothetical protein